MRRRGCRIGLRSGRRAAQSGQDAQAAQASPRDVRVPGWAFAGPDAIAADGARVWVANNGGDSVTELSAATGALVRVIAGRQYQLNGPVAVTADATHVWVANATGNSLTEINAATGALIRVISAPRYQLNAKLCRTRGQFRTQNARRRTCP